MWIYELSHPSTDVFYIGKANDIQSRVNQHIKNSPWEKSWKKSNWINHLKDNGLTPEAKILCECNEESWREWEIVFIATYRLKYGYDKVLNISDGGKQGPSRKGAKFSQKQRDQIKEDYATGKRAKPTASFKQTVSDEIIKDIFRLNSHNISTANIGKQVGISQQHVSAILRKENQYMKDSKWDSYIAIPFKRFRTQDEKKKISEFMMGNKFSLGVVPSEETRQKISAAGKGRMFTQEHKDKISQSMIESHKRKNTQPLENK